MGETQTVVEEGQSGAAATKPPVSTETPKTIDGSPKVPQELLDRLDRAESELKLTKNELKGLQSRQDKEKNETQRLLGEIEKRMAKGASYEDAKAAATDHIRSEDKDELLIRIAQKVGVLDSPAAQSAGNRVSEPDELAKVVAKYELSENDPDVIENARGRSGDALEAAMANLALRRMKQNPPSAAAAAAQQSSAAPKSDKSQDQLLREYSTEMNAARGNKGLLKQIKAKYQGLGLNVDSVVFT